MPKYAPTNRAGVAYPRRRSTAACQTCRARKTKCDQKKPRCSFCESINASCCYDPVSFSGFDPASLAILEQIQALSNKLDYLSQRDVVDVSAVERSVKHAERIFPENIDVILRWQLMRPYQSTVGLDGQHISPASRIDSAMTPSIVDTLEPVICSRWLDNFFNFVHVKNPVLNEESCRGLVRQICHHGIGWNAESCLALLICANGALTLPYPNSAYSQRQENSAIAEVLYQAAQRRLGLTMESDESTQAQCFFFAGVYLMSILRPLEAWRMFLQALAVCQSFISSAQFDPSGPRSTDQTCIYWSCWKSEREVRSELDLPDFSDSTPAHVQSFPRLEGHLEGEALRAGYFFLSEISLWRLETKAKHELAAAWAAIASGDFGQVLHTTLDLFNQLSDWQESLAPSVNIDSTPGDHEQNDVLRFVLKGRMTYYNELVSWSYIVTALEVEHLPLEMERVARTGFESHVERLKINTPGFYYRHHGTWLMMRSSARSACILLMAAQKPFTVTLLPHDWMSHVRNTIDMLHFWSAEIASFGNISDILRQLLANVTT